MDGGVSRDASTTLTRGGGATIARGGKGRRLGRRLDPCPPCSDRDALIDWVSGRSGWKYFSSEVPKLAKAFLKWGC